MRPTRASLRRLRLGLRTLLGGTPGGFFIPYRHAAGVRSAAYSALEPLFHASMPAMSDWLAHIDAVGEELQALDGPPPAPRWGQDWFPRLDGAALYAIVRHQRPRHILEIGSGHSTRFVAQAIQDGGIACAVTCIDPAPRADIGRLPVTLHRRLFAAADADLARSLAAGDILFIDSSHVAMPGTDVDLLLNTVLPRLQPGVLVHVHDIFLPDPYPPSWAWRGYNEQVVVAGLLHGGGYAIRFASHFVATRYSDRLAESTVAGLPLLAGALESSLWLEKLPTASVVPGEAQSA